MKQKFSNNNLFLTKMHKAHITYKMIKEIKHNFKKENVIYGITCIGQFYKVKEPQVLSNVD